MNAALVAGGPDAPPPEQVTEAADTLHYRMQAYELNLRRSLPGSTPRGGRNKASNAATFSVPAAVPELTLQLGMLIEAIRAGVELFAAAVSTLLAFASHTNSSIAWSRCSCLA